MPRKHENQNIKIPVTLSRTLGVWEVTLLGIGALLGGGIFTLLGHAAGLAGGGLIFAILLGALISFLNLNSYVSLATTFPAAGGGYHWVREGLGDMQGFLSGWFSWMASSVACSLYAISFGLFAFEFVFSLIGLPLLGVSQESWKIIFTVFIILLFGLINYRGVALSGKIGGWISLSILSILILYILFGFKKIGSAPEVFTYNFFPLLPLGLGGVLQAAGLFYIAFEGSEIQAQAGEEAKDPARTLKIGFFSSWAIISVLYLLISLVIIGATDSSSIQSWKILGGYSERAIIESAKQFLPFGYILMVIGGLLANIAALNATIYSSSRVLFAMARDKFVWSRLGEMHEINLTPYRAIILSLAIIIIVSLFLPIKDIASAADFLFIALFSQLNLSYIELRRQKPEVKWQYVVPFGIILPLSAIILYVVLGISLFHVSPIGIYFTVFWFLMGLINYFSYTKVQERTNMENEIVYEHATRFREKLGYRIILSVVPDSNLYEFKSQIAFAMARQEDGELLILRVHEVPASLPLSAGFHSEQERRVLEKIEKSAIEKKFNVETRLSVARSIPDTILETVKMEKGDLLIMGWDGYTNTKGFIFGRKVDVVLHRTKCDFMVIKLVDLGNMNPVRGHTIETPADSAKPNRTSNGVKKILIPVSLDENPNLRFAGKVATALSNWFGGSITVLMVIPEKTGNLDYAKYYAVLEDRIRELKIKTALQPKIKLVRSDFIASSILKEAGHYDVVLMPASRGRITKAIRMGSIPEQVAKHCNKTVIMAKGHRGIVQPFFDYVKSRF